VLLLLHLELPSSLVDDEEQHNLLHCRARTGDEEEEEEAKDCTLGGGFCGTYATRPRPTRAPEEVAVVVSVILILAAAAASSPP
jgi:hypothetical protein